MFDEPISAVLEGSKFMTLPSSAIPESQEITVIPLSIAFLPIEARASLSFAEIAIASTFCAIKELITSICASAVVVAGPVYITSIPPISDAASWPPSAAASKKPIPKPLTTNAILISAALALKANRIDEITTKNSFFIS